MVQAIIREIFKHSTPAVILNDSHGISNWPVEANQVKHVKIPIPAGTDGSKAIHGAMIKAGGLGLKVIRSSDHYRIEGGRGDVWNQFANETLALIPHRPAEIEIDSQLKMVLDTLFKHSKPAFAYRGSKTIRMNPEPVDLAKVGHVRIPYTRETKGILAPAIDALKERGLKVILREGYATIEVTRSREHYSGKPEWREFARAALERAGFRVNPTRW